MIGYDHKRTLWRATGPADFIEPMQVLPVRELPDGGQWTYEAKLDGYRCLVARRRGTPALWSRRGTILTPRFPKIVWACEKLPADTLIDGEVIVVGEDGRCSFNGLQHSRPKGHVQLYAFDILVHRGRTVLKLPIEERRQLLTEALRKVQYEPGKRSGVAWLKYKINKSQEFVIGGYTHGHPFDALIVGVYDDSGLKFVEKVRAGFVGRMRADLYALMKPLLTEKCPFVNLPEKRRTAWSLTAEEMKNCCWVRPELVAQIAFAEWTPDGHLRHSSFSGLREDKDPRAIVRE